MPSPARVPASYSLPLAPSSPRHLRPPGCWLPDSFGYSFCSSRSPAPGWMLGTPMGDSRTSTASESSTSGRVLEAAARGLLARLLPSHSDSFDFRIISTDQCGGKACFIVDNHPLFDGEGTPEVVILGISGVEISAGLLWYLRHYCSAHISWGKTGGAQFSSVPCPGSLPRVPSGGILIQRPVGWSYYQNTVTSSYSFAWWDWERWEKEIDWMALEGINLRLAFTGQEAIWQKVFQRYNISKSDLDDFFGGPAFLAWSRMANMHGWGGPLTQSWLDDQLVLQKKILSRMYSFGMFPGSQLTATQGDVAHIFWMHLIPYL